MFPILLLLWSTITVDRVTQSRLSEQNTADQKVHYRDCTVLEYQSLLFKISPMVYVNSQRRDSRRRGLCDFVGTAAAVESSSSSSQATRRINTLSGFLPLKKIFQKRGTNCTELYPNFY